MSTGHSHTHSQTAPFDWFKVMDIMIWVSVFLIVVLGAEWLIGTMVRESLARGASRHLAKVAAPETPAP